MRVAVTAGTIVLVLSQALAGSPLHSFVSIGDWGGAALGDYHKTDELVVAKQFGITAQNLNAQFVLNTGDNFYYYGVKSVDDKQWETTFENVYTSKSLMVPWYGVLGNHDYGYNPDAQLQYKSPNNDRWQIPDRYYTRRIQIGTTGRYITLVAIDTSPCMKDYRGDDESKWDPCGSTYPGPSDCVFHQNVLNQSCGEQLLWLKSAMGKIPESDWKIVMGHSPADELDVEDLTSVFQEAGFDLYLNGHTHVLSRYQIDGIGAYMTTGAGCMVEVSTSTKVKPKRRVGSLGHSYESIWSRKVAGFSSHTFSSDLESLTTTFWDYNGMSIYNFTVTRGKGPGPSPSPPGPSPGPAPGSCCHYSDQDCSSGEVCCRSGCDDPSSCSYTQRGCASSYGKKHNCQWGGGICTVGKN